MLWCVADLDLLVDRVVAIEHISDCIICSVAGLLICYVFYCENTWETLLHCALASCGRAGGVQTTASARSVCVSLGAFFSLFIAQLFCQVELPVLPPRRFSVHSGDFSQLFFCFSDCVYNTNFCFVVLEYLHSASCFYWTQLSKNARCYSRYVQRSFVKIGQKKRNMLQN